MPKPWIKDCILKLLENPKRGSSSKPQSSKSKGKTKHESKITQVIRVFPEENLLVINDKDHKILVALTPKCAEDLRNKLSNDGVELSSLKNSIVSIKDWHVSVVEH